MKKLVLFFLMICAITTVEAQFGVKAGINIANWGGEEVDEDGKKSLIAPYFGAYYNVKLNQSFSFQPDMVFSMQGVRYEADDEETKLNANYINTAALIRWNSPSGFFVGTGPQLGLLVSAKYHVGDSELDVKDDLNNIDLSWSFMAGYQLKGGLGFYARYNHGLSNVDELAEIKNRVFGIGLRYNIFPGKGDPKGSDPKK